MSVGEQIALVLGAIFGGVVLLVFVIGFIGDDVTSIVRAWRRRDDDE